MKTRILLSMLSTLAFAVLPAGAASYAVDLSPVPTDPEIVVVPSTTGIIPKGVWNYTIAEGAIRSPWRANIENTQGKVSIVDSKVVLEINNQQTGNGNFIATKFELPTEATSATLSFDVAKTADWIGTTSAFAAQYTADIYGYAADGAFTKIGNWQLPNAQSLTLNSSQNIEIVLDLSASDYVSYGLIFNSKRTATGGGGIGLSFSNIQVTGSAVPEPSSALLGALALGGLLLHRRRRK